MLSNLAMFISTIRQFFPNSIIKDAALKFPITQKGWEVDMPDEGECRFDEPDFWLILNLQDMLTGGWGKMPYELKQIHNYYQTWAPLHRIIVIVWPMGLANTWPEESFHVVEFSTHQYDTWQSYKEQEDVLRDAFSVDKKEYEFNFLCMNRIKKPHRQILYDRLSTFPEGNCSLQTAGYELAHAGIDLKTYDDQYDNLSNLLSLKKAFNTSFFSVVSESQYAEQYGIITEKTFNAIVAGHPFMLCAHGNAIAQVNELGFKSWNNLFNELYDEVPGNARIDDMIFDNLAWFDTKISPSDLHDLYMLHRDTIDYNRNFFFEEFGDKQIAWLRAQLLNVWN